MKARMIMLLAILMVAMTANVTAGRAIPWEPEPPRAFLGTIAWVTTQAVLRAVEDGRAFGRGQPAVVVTATLEPVPEPSLWVAEWDGVPRETAAVPEPSTGWLLISGMVAGVRMCIKKRRNHEKHE